MAPRQEEIRELKAQNRQLEKALRDRERELYSIQRIGKALSSTLHLNELLNLIMQEITTLMDADRSSLFLVDHERKQIWSKIALKAEVKEIRLPLGKGISGHVAAAGEIINIPDAYKDKRFDPATDKRTGYRTRSILCIPVWNPAAPGDLQKIIGVIQVLNKKQGVFTAEDETLLEALAGQVAISISHAWLYDRLAKKFRETDLLYDVEQLLSSEYELPDITQKILHKTVAHLKARWVLAYFPVEGQYWFLGVNDRGEERFMKHAAVSLGWANFAQHPSPAGLTDRREECRQYFEIAEDLDSLTVSALVSPIRFYHQDYGVLMALGLKAAEGQDFEDERIMLELVAQMISRAQEIYQLRETALKRERLSAIGQMMSTVVHDIRGPVNTIYGFMDLIEDTNTSPGERREFAEIIRDEIKSAMNMITEVLDFAKGKTSILPRKTSVDKLVKRFMPRLQQMCQQQNTELVIAANSKQLLYADEEKLNRVFYNITKNALEAMGTGGKFHFEVTDDGREVAFRFSDTGPGIPRDIRRRLFDSFVTSGKESGTGLGLAIVKKIVDEHHGEIEIDSREGEGATFLIKLPVYR